MEGEPFAYTPPSEEELSRSRRQQSLYNVSMFFKDRDLSVDEILEAAGKFSAFVEG